MLVIALFAGLDLWTAFRLFVEARNYSPASKETVFCPRCRTPVTRWGVSRDGVGILLPLLVPPPAGRDMIPPAGGVTYVLVPWVKKRFQGVRFRSRGRDGRAPGHRDLLAGSTAVFLQANRAAEADAQSAALHERKTDGHDNQDHPMAETLADQDRVPNEIMGGAGETPQEEGESTQTPHP